MNVQLILLRGQTRLRTIRRRSAVTLIGREPGCAVRIPSPDVGGHHCLLYCQGDELTVEDLGSPGGTWVNGQRVRGKQPVRPGDRLTVGPLTFLVELGETAAEEGPAVLEVGAAPQAPAEEPLPTAEVLPEAPEVVPARADVSPSPPVTAVRAAPPETVQPAGDEPPRVILLPDEESDGVGEAPAVPVAAERPPTAVAADEAEAEAPVELAEGDAASLPVALALGAPADDAGGTHLPDAAPSPTAAETAGAVGKEAGRFAGKFATDVGKGVGKGLVQTVLGRLLTDLLFERPWRPRADGVPEADQPAEAPAEAPELRPVVRMTCPHCEAPAWTTADRRGAVLLCPRCRRQLLVPRRAARDAGQAVPGAAAPRRGWGLRILTGLIAGLLAIAAWLWVSGWWGPLLWQPLQALLRVHHVPKEVALWGAAVVFAVVGYWLLKLRMLQRIRTEVDLFPCRPGDFPWLDRAELVRYTRAFEALGFVRVMDYSTQRDRRRRGSGFGRLLVNPARKCFAEINQVFPAQAPPGPMRCMVLTRFEDGWSLSATDRRMLGAAYMMRRPRKLWTSNPRATPAQLLAGHLKRRDALAADLDVEVLDDLTTEAYFAHVRQGVAEMRQAVWRKNLLLGMIEAKLHDASPHTEWLGEYARLAARKKPR